MLTRPQHMETRADLPASPAVRRGLRERLLDWRDRMVVRPSFRRWAARFFLTKPVARRQSSKLFDVASGFVKSQTLLACVRLQVLERLMENPMRPAELGAQVGLSEDATQRLLSAAGAVELVSLQADGRYRLGGLGAAVVGEPGIRAMVEHNATFYADLADPVALLKGASRPTQLEQYWAYSGDEQAAGLQASEVSAYSELMAESQRMVAEEVLAVYPVGKRRLLLDVGGGEGAFVEAAANAAADLNISVFDLPAVAERATQRMQRLGLSARFQAHGGNFFTDSLPQGADLVTLVRVLHDHDDAEAMQLLRNIKRSMLPGQTLLIAEPMAGIAHSRAVGDAYFAFYLLAMGRGRARTPAEIASMLEAAGFSNPGVIATNQPVITQLIRARS
jgi:demethylspheroidene O-methyltransferase